SRPSRSQPTRAVRLRGRPSPGWLALSGCTRSLSRYSCSADSPHDLFPILSGFVLTCRFLLSPCAELPCLELLLFIPKTRVRAQHLVKCCSATDVPDGVPLRDGLKPTAIQRIRYLIGEKVRRGGTRTAIYSDSIAICR